MGEPDSSTPPVYSPIISSRRCSARGNARAGIIASHPKMCLNGCAPERLTEAVWVAGPVRCRASRIVRKLAQARYGWPNDRFTPCDPVFVVFLYPRDDLEVVELLIRIEGALHVAIQDSHVEFRRTVGDVVDEPATLMPAREANPGAG